MSNVFRRNRKETGLELFVVSAEIMERLTRFLMNTNYVPKGYRYLYTYPICEIAHSMRRNITAANSIYPTNEHELQMRRDYQQKAINDCENIIRALQDMICVLTGIDVDKLEALGKLLVKEATLLRAWRKSSKVLKSN